MKSEEAIKTLTSNHPIVVTARNCGKTLYAEAIKTAVEALEKQTPFAPETNHLKVGLGRCKCGAEFLDKLTNYCGNCGQRLDWEGENDSKRAD